MSLLKRELVRRESVSGPPSSCRLYSTLSHITAQTLIWKVQSVSENVVTGTRQGFCVIYVKYMLIAQCHGIE